MYIITGISLLQSKKAYDMDLYKDGVPLGRQLKIQVLYWIQPQLLERNLLSQSYNITYQTYTPIINSVQHFPMITLA